MSSLRTKLLLGTATTLAVILVAAGATLYAVMRASLVGEFDTALSREAAALTALTEQDGDAVEIEAQAAGASELASADRPHYFEMWSADAGADDGSGTGTVARSLSLRAGEHLPRPSPIPPPQQPTRYESLRLPSGEPGRAVVMRFHPRVEAAPPHATPPKTLVLTLARDTQQLDAALARLRWLLGGVSAGAVVAGACAAAWVIGRGLRPLETVAGAIGRVGVSDLSERIDPAAAGAPREVAPVVQRLNELLARVESAVERERAFTADVAHELRTPLASLSMLLEVCASRGRDAEAYREVVGKSLGVTRGMQAMVNNLLLLARADGNQLTVRHEPVDVAALLRESWAAYEPEARERGLRVEWHVDVDVDADVDADGPPAVARSDRDLLRMIAGNLFSNAVTYADAGGRVTVRVEPRGADEFAVSVANTGSQVAPADAAKVFDRFWRGDAARRDAGVRCGLGLPLCRKLADALGGQISATSGAEGVFTVQFTLPADAPAPSVPPSSVPAGTRVANGAFAPAPPPPFPPAPTPAQPLYRARNASQDPPRPLKRAGRR